MLSENIETIIMAAHDGDEEAFELLYQEYRGIVLAKIYRISGNANDAEDICQEVFLKVHTSIHNLRDAKAFPLWIHRITKNKIADYYREHHEINLEDDVLEAVLNNKHGNENVPRKAQRHKSDRELLEFFVSCLPKASAEVIRLMYLEQKSQTEISKLLGVPVNTIKSRAFYGRKELRSMIMQYEKNNDIKLDFHSPAFLPLFTFPFISYIHSIKDRYKEAVRSLMVTGVAAVVIVTGVDKVLPNIKEQQNIEPEAVNSVQQTESKTTFQPTMAHEIMYEDAQSAYFALMKFADIYSIEQKTKEECIPYQELVNEMIQHGGQYHRMLNESGWLEEFQKKL